jgi:hypothetical protein
VVPGTRPRLVELILQSAELSSPIQLLIAVLTESYKISETGFCLRHQVKPNQLGPIDRASPYLRPPAPTQDMIHKPPSTAQTICES